jgi:hypothetical protein
MTNHLRPGEFVDAMDGALSTARGAHLEKCAECRAELDGLLSMQREAHADDAPEPSPLFWDHFSARVREATARENGRPAPWWRTGWQPIAALTVAATAVVLMLQMRSTPADVALELAPVASATDLVIPAFDDDGSWDIVMGLASGIAWDDIRDAVTPAAGAADAAIEELTSAQREALVRLLKQEIGE